MTEEEAPSDYAHKDPQDVDDFLGSFRFMLNSTRLTFNTNKAPPERHSDVSLGFARQFL